MALTKIVPVLLASAALVWTQSGRSYGPTRLWWGPGEGGLLPWDETYENPLGHNTLVNAKGPVQTQGHPFFEALGSNGRACVSCHQPANAMTVSSALLQERWRETAGRDPVFAAIDGSNCPDLPQEASDSHGLLLHRGLFRIALRWPPEVTPEFRIEVVRDPAGCNTSPKYGIGSTHPAISVYRRPRMAANLDAVIAGPAGVAFMADGREPSLASQARTAILVHEEAQSPPSQEQLRQIVELERGIYAAQSADIRAGLLNEQHGPIVLGPQNLAQGRAGTLGSESADSVLRSFETWRTRVTGNSESQRDFRVSVARGGTVFYTRKFSPKSTQTCATCHRPGVNRWMDIGTTNRAAADALPDLPLFRVTCNSDAPPHPTLGRVIYTQDPGRALISGKCADVGSIVVPQLRGLAARAPYFSNGSAADLRELVDFYDRRFGIGYSEREKQDLIHFLGVL